MLPIKSVPPTLAMNLRAAFATPLRDRTTYLMNRIISKLVRIISNNTASSSEQSAYEESTHLALRGWSLSANWDCYVLDYSYFRASYREHTVFDLVRMEGRNHITLLFVTLWWYDSYGLRLHDRYMHTTRISRLLSRLPHFILHLKGFDLL